MEQNIETLGAILSPYDIRDYRMCLSSSITSEEAVWNNLSAFECDNLTSVHNQGAVGSCVAEAISTICEYAYQRETGQYIPMSTSWIYGNRRNSSHKGTGMIVSQALENLLTFGEIYKDACADNLEVPNALEYFEERYPLYKHSAEINRIKNYYRLKTAEEIRASLYTNGPVLAVIRIYENHRMATVDDMKIYKPIEPKGKSRGCHAIIIYGWCSEGWCIQNSWGEGWGKNGRAVIPYDTELLEIWACEDAHTDGKTLLEAQLDKEIDNLIFQCTELQRQLDTTSTLWTDKIVELESQLNAVNEANLQIEQAKEFWKNLAIDLKDQCNDQKLQIQTLENASMELQKLLSETSDDIELIQQLLETIEQFHYEMAKINNELNKKELLIDSYQEQINKCPYTILKRNWKGIKRIFALTINFIANLFKKQ